MLCAAGVLLGVSPHAAAQDLQSSWLDDLLVTDDESAFMKFARTSYAVNEPEGEMGNEIFTSDEWNNSFEVMKQYALYGDEGRNSWKTGWRFDSYLGNYSLAFGDEVLGTGLFADEPSESMRPESISDFLKSIKTNTYLTGGLRLYDYGSSWSSGSYSHDSRTTMIGPQFGGGAVAESGPLRFEAVGLGFIGYRHHNREWTSDRWRDGGYNENEAIAGFELRLTASARLTEHARFDTGWRSSVLSSPDFIDDAIEWRITDGFGGDAYMGITLTW